jgi:hypothetical protein
MNQDQAERIDGPATRRFPFAGITDRPYFQANINERIKDWRTITPQWVFLPDLWLTQAKVNIAGLFGKTYSTDPFPRAVRLAGVIYLEDGHHRVVDAALSGTQWLQMRVFDT